MRWIGPSRSIWSNRVDLCVAGVMPVSGVDQRVTVRAPLLCHPDQGRDNLDGTRVLPSTKQVMHVQAPALIRRAHEIVLDVDYPSDTFDGQVHHPIVHLWSQDSIGQKSATG